jgi:hypothetical protein
VSGPDIKGQVRSELLEGGFFLMQHIDLEYGGQLSRVSKSSVMSEDLELLNPARI